MRWWTRALWSLVPVLLASTVIPGSTTRVATSGPRLEATVTISQPTGSPARVCVYWETQPVCPGGPRLRNFSWDGLHPEHEQGIRWLEANIVGRYHNGDFVLTEKPGPPRPHPYQPPSLEPPCPPPTGGWSVEGLQRATESDFTSAVSYARATPEFAGVWITPNVVGSTKADRANDVLIVGFTSNVEQRTAEIRARWGGMLCVVQHRFTMRELRGVADGIPALADRNTGFLPISSGVDERDNVVDVKVLIAGPANQGRMDRLFGPGRVRLEGIFQPV